MGELADLEIDEYEAFEQVVVEDQIDEAVFIFNAQVLLAGDKGETLAQLQQEGLQLLDEAGFQLALEEGGAGLASMNSRM